MSIEKKKIGAPYGNKNAEKWTFIKAARLFIQTLNMSYEGSYDFIGEIARDLGTSRHIYTDLSIKFPSLKQVYNRINSNLEANCFQHAKKGDIKEATAIMNLKSNHKWTDRVDNTTKDKEIQQKTVIKWGDNEIEV